MYLKGNKEANRPHYYCFKEEKVGLYWMIPLSSKVEKYKRIMNQKIERKYTIANNHLRVTSEHSAIEIEKKAKKVMNMLKKGIKFTPTQPDILKIMNKLKVKNL